MVFALYSRRNIDTFDFDAHNNNLLYNIMKKKTHVFVRNSNILNVEVKMTFKAIKNIDDDNVSVTEQKII